MTKLKKFIKTPYFFLLMATLIITIPLFNNEILFGHDSIFHLFRTYSTYIGFKEKELIPLFNPYMLNNFGYASNIFYSPFPIYFILIIKLFTKTFSLAINISIIISVFLSGLIMYNFSNHLTKNKYISLIISLSYTLAPYHLYDIYVRFSLGEIYTYLFIPLLFEGIYHILNQNYNKWYYLTIGTAGLFFTHNITVFMSLIIAIFYCLLNYQQLFNKKTILTFVKSLSFALLLSSAVIIPLLEAKLTTNYMVFNPEFMHTNGNYMARNLVNILNFQTSHLYLITISYLVIAILTLIYCLHKHQKNNLKLITIIIISLIFTTLMPWQYLPNFLSLPQYPWRYLIYTTFFTCFLAIFILKDFSLKLTKKRTIVILSILLLTAFPYLKVGFTNETYSEENLLDNSLSKKEGNILIANGTGQSEYLPKNAIDKYNYFRNRKNIPLSFKGSNEISKIKKNGATLSFTIDAETPSKIEIPYIYYPGFKVKFQNKKINYYETKNGLIGIDIPASKGNVTITFKGSTSTIIGYLITSLSVVAFVYIIHKEKVEKTTNI